MLDGRKAPEQALGQGCCTNETSERGMSCRSSHTSSSSHGRICTVAPHHSDASARSSCRKSRSRDVWRSAVVEVESFPVMPYDVPCIYSKVCGCIHLRMMTLHLTQAILVER